MPAPHLIALDNQLRPMIAALASGTEFDSHPIILKLAKENQVEYVKALQHYSTTSSDPFRQLHRQLSTLIGTYTTLVDRLEDWVTQDIFDEKVSNAAWRRR